MENVILSCEDCMGVSKQCSSIGTCKRLVLNHLLRILKERYTCGGNNRWIIITPAELTEIEKEIEK
jgi:hypothetical protein